MKKQVALSLVALLTLGGCVTFDEVLNNQNNNVVAKASITDIQITLPPQLKWKAEQANNATTVYLPNGYDMKTSPIHVVKVKSANTNANLLAQQAVQPLRQNCESFTINNFPINSQYANKVSYKAVCSQIKGRKNGLIKYVSIFSDASGSQLLSSEVKTPIINENGQFKVAKNSDGTRVAKMTVNMVKATQKMMSEALVCESNNICQ